MKLTRSVVPSLFTVLNMFCGFLSIVHTSRTDYTLAAWFIILAAVFDSLDGVMARLTKSSSDFGVEFDSLSDVVSFGVAPSFLVYSIQLRSLEGIGMLISAMPMVFGALRLARFNVQLVGYDKDYFKGLPIPSAAVTLCAFILSSFQEGILSYGLEARLLAPMVVIVSLLMVSSIPYDTLPRFSRRGIKQHPLRFTIAVIGLTAIVLTKGQALFPFFLFYVASGPLRYMVHFVGHALHPAGKAGEAEETEVTSIDV